MVSPSAVPAQPWAPIKMLTEAPYLWFLKKDFDVMAHTKAKGVHSKIS